jgi:hypothetical protein
MCGSKPMGMAHSLDLPLQDGAALPRPASFGRRVPEFGQPMLDVGVHVAALFDVNAAAGPVLLEPTETHVWRQRRKAPAEVRPCSPGTGGVTLVGPAIDVQDCPALPEKAPV